MQSEADRLLTWAQKQVREGLADPPYEVHMAMIALDDSIKEWTEARK